MEYIYWKMSKEHYELAAYDNEAYDRGAVREDGKEDEQGRLTTHPITIRRL